MTKRPRRQPEASHLFLQHAGLKVWHFRKHGTHGPHLSYWYAMNPDGTQDFDVRTLPGYRKYRDASMGSRAYHCGVITRAIRDQVDMVLVSAEHWAIRQAEDEVRRLLSATTSDLDSEIPF